MIVNTRNEATKGVKIAMPHMHEQFKGELMSQIYSHIYV